MNWLRALYDIFRQFVLIEDRIRELSEKVKRLADSYQDIHDRLNRIEAKFDFMEQVAFRNRHTLPAKSTK